MSSNRGVNNAERAADYWVFGGLFRPVWLEARPALAIERSAIDARADGRFSIDVFLTGDAAGAAGDGAGRGRGRRRRRRAARGLAAVASGAKVTLRGRFENPRQWTAETPHLYRVRLTLDVARRPADPHDDGALRLPDDRGARRRRRIPQRPEDRPEGRQPPRVLARDRAHRLARPELRRRPADEGGEPQRRAHVALSARRALPRGVRRARPVRARRAGGMAEALRHGGRRPAHRRAGAPRRQPPEHPDVGQRQRGRLEREERRRVRQVGPAGAPGAPPVGGQQRHQHRPLRALRQHREAQRGPDDLHADRVPARALRRRHRRGVPRLLGRDGQEPDGGRRVLLGVGRRRRRPDRPGRPHRHRRQLGAGRDDGPAPREGRQLLHGEGDLVADPGDAARGRGGRAARRRGTAPSASRTATTSRRSTAAGSSGSCCGSARRLPAAPRARSSRRDPSPLRRSRPAHRERPRWACRRRSRAGGRAARDGEGPERRVVVDVVRQAPAGARPSEAGRERSAPSRPRGRPTR